MKYCIQCVMPDTRPNSVFDSQGVCLACRNYEKDKLVDWGKRKEELINLCSKYRRQDGYYDCVIPVSGGKDSHFQVYVMKEVMGMNPLLICVSDPFTHTATGTHNLRNISESFRCDLLIFNLSIDLFKRVTKMGFDLQGYPLRFIEAAIYSVPYKYAVALGIPLIVFGENSAYRYGTTNKDSYSAKKDITALGNEIVNYWHTECGIPMVELNSATPPLQTDLDRVKPEPIYMSYFVPWDDEHNRDIAKRYGFRDLHHEWKREGYIDDYGQIDSIAYMIHPWLKYPKFGFSRTSDITSRWIRKGMATREQAVELVRRHDHVLDQRALGDFTAFLGYSTKQFWTILEPFWNRDIFENVDGIWKLRKEIE
jgi:N-acetyl sugar amidotransferase